MKSGTRHGSPLSDRFRRLLLQLARQSHRDLARIPIRPERAIHTLRTRMKKFRAIVCLVKTRIPARSCRAILASARRLRRAFSAQRDAQVAANLGFRGKAIATRRTAPALFDEALRLLGLVEAESLDGLTREEVRDAYFKNYRAGRKLMRACLKDPEPVLLHSWRKPVKILYYQSLLLHDAPGMKRRIRRARKLGRWLGQDHDWQLVIEAHPEAADGIAPARERQRRRIFKLARTLYSKQPEKLGRKLDPYHPIA